MAANEQIPVKMYEAIQKVISQDQDDSLDAVSKMPSDDMP